MERCLSKILVQTILIARKDFEYSYSCHDRVIASITSLRANCCMNSAMEIYEKLDKVVRSKNNLKLLQDIIDDALIMLTPAQRSIVFMKFFKGCERGHILKTLNMCNWKYDYLLNQSYEAIATRLMVEGVTTECFEQLYIDNPIFNTAFETCIERQESCKRNFEGGTYGKKEKTSTRCEHRGDKRVVVAPSGRLYYQRSC